LPALFLSVFAARRGGWSVGTLPTGYGNLQTRIDASTSSANAGVAAAYRTATVDTEDPSEWVITYTTAPEQTLSATIAVLGAAAGVSITSTTKLQDEKSFTITGTTFGADAGDNGRVLISPTDDAADTDAVVQTVNTWGDTSLVINSAALPVGATPGTTLYLFVRNDAEEQNADGFAVQVADPALKVNELLRDTDSGVLVTESVELIVIGGAPGSRAIVYQNDTGVSIASGVLTEEDDFFDIATIGNEYQAVIIGDGQSEDPPINRAAVVPATVVDLNDV
jgi:hypothetical protein